MNDPPTGPAGTAADLVELDDESADWVRALSGTGAQRHTALERLHDMLLRAALRETRRRAAGAPVSGPELDDVAQQAASDAMVAILAKLSTFRGESRFTTWAYRFAVLEVSSKLGRHYWRNPTVALDSEEWDRLPDRLGLDPSARAESAELVAAVRRAVDDRLTAHQRRVFVAIVVDGVPLDALVARLEVSRNALYKVVFDARRKIRAALVSDGYLDERR
ncbi:MAG TPA: sigma-70 family RNA polymerase sigma factor [Streptosporangiales bacterium]